MRAEALLLLALAACGTVEEPKLAPAWSEADAARPLTHADCVRLATRSASTAAAWEARRRAAEAALRQAGKLPNPTLAASWEDFGLGSGGGPLQQTFSLGMALEAVFARGRREAAASHALLAELADLQAEEARLAREVGQGYDALAPASPPF